MDYLPPEMATNFAETNEEKAATHLHDVIEDNSLALLDLKEYGLSKTIIEAINILTTKDKLIRLILT